jgi:hypothetical protein
MTHGRSFEAAKTPKTTPWLLFPREHGSWGMLLFPLVSALILTRTWSWDFVPAVGAALAVFLIREPLVVVARQRYVWKDKRPETAAAHRSLAAFGALAALSGAWLMALAPLGWLIALGLVAAGLTAAYIYGALHNLQRSPLLQIAGAVGLTASALLPYLALGRLPDERLLLLMAAQVIHGAGSVLVIHARLEAARALKTGAMPHTRHVAAASWLVLHAIVAAALALTGRPWLGLILAIPLAVHAVDLARLKDPQFLRTPLRRVGFRELGISTVFSILVVAVLR